MLITSLTFSAQSESKTTFELYTKACDKGSINGCVNLAKIYYNGDGVKQDFNMAKKLFIRACNRRQPKACFYAANIYKRGAKGVQRNIRKSKLLFARGCRLGYAQSCDQYNLIREKREVIGAETDANAKAFNYTYSTEIYGG